MGIHGLSKVLGDYAPSSLKENDIKNYFGQYDLQKENESLWDGIDTRS